MSKYIDYILRLSQSDLRRYLGQDAIGRKRIVFRRPPYCNLEECFASGTGSDFLNLDMPDSTPGKYEFASANIVAIRGLDEALKEVKTCNINGTEKELLDYLIDKLSDIEGVHMYLPPKDKHIGMISFIVDGYKSEDIGIILDANYDIAVRTGYHCAPLIHKWLKDENTSGTVRVGIERYNTRQQIDVLIEDILL